MSALLVTIVTSACTPFTSLGQNVEKIDNSTKFVHFLSPDELSAQILQPPIPDPQVNIKRVSELEYKARLLRQPVLTVSDRSNLLRGSSKLN